MTLSEGIDNQLLEGLNQQEITEQEEGTKLEETVKPEDGTNPEEMVKPEEGTNQEEGMRLEETVKPEEKTTLVAMTSTAEGEIARPIFVKAKPDTEPHWFVMRDLKRANAKLPAYKQFMEAKIEIFTPMHIVLKTVKGRQRRIQEPFIRDLLFVHDTRENIDRIVEVTPTIQYRYERGKGYQVPMTVSDDAMNRFIMAVSTSKSTKYYLPSELKPNMVGRSIRVTGGPLQGYTGKLLKIQGSRAKRIIVQLEGLLSAGVEVETQYIEVL